MNNEKGGIISKLFIVPIGVALMVGFFFLGYYVGKYQSRTAASEEIAPPLPEIASNDGRKLEEFTFYKTLADKNDKTVSIDLKTKPVKEAPKTTPISETPKEKRTEVNLGKEAPSTARPKQLASKQQQPAGREPAEASSSAKLRYTVQTASYQERAMAVDEVKRLKKRGFAAFIVSSELPGKGVWHRVRLGSFSNKAAAERLQKAVREKEGILTIVVLE